MHIVKINRDDSDNAKGLVVVIDVLRAFTTAAYAFAAGAEKIIVVREVEEALQLHAEMPESLIIGEVHGKPVEGFHFCNSPFQIQNVNFTGKTLIQRTSCGTKGVVNAMEADHILVASFVVATATIDRIRMLAPEQLTLMITGQIDSSEDVAFAEYVEACLHQKDNVDDAYFLNQVTASSSARYLMQNSFSHSPQEDLEAAICINKFSFAMEVHKEGGRLHIHPVKACGEKWIQK